MEYAVEVGALVKQFRMGCGGSDAEDGMRRIRCGGWDGIGWDEVEFMIYIYLGDGEDVPNFFLFFVASVEKKSVE